MLEVINATKVYGKGHTRVVALDSVSFTIDNGEFVTVMGPSGSGKSTLLNVIGGLDNLSDGQVILDGKRIDNLEENDLVEIRRLRLAYVFQQYHLLPSLSAIQNVMMPLIFSGIEDPYEKAEHALKEVGLQKRAEHKPGQLSGGEQQRVAISRALVSNPAFILADEPTGNMDRKTGNGILTLFEKLNRNGVSILMVTHDREIARYASRTIFLQDGRMVDQYLV